ncbi:7,8-didemethyl-8-hydroxy-5-deazariboflavin synthase subunit CofG [Leptolyngbya iicbica]|uniref:7,8-didemethyl-8-hydroxy-5-deazariboflavin synthase n=2 Tax=Cyanophyceae TaxID=3028117 RepID=A0A4Q7E1M2_9CYAN|nr:7,8-didemethyl-8-hydroxy-5-deazariboflavin synthase subunit CofG [Leptolyngbya sp. LK]RZM75423.1 7,8-didemethyl-8-hydroxy-5-deazariboflavin synthase subunit CofG [Leptolyngbya sp. LK]
MLTDPDRVITYSPALTVVPTYECFNRCTYCNFRAEPGQATWLSRSQLAEQLARAKSHGLVEILVLSGEVHPESPRRAAWLQHIVDICDYALQQGLLPHTNVGPLSEMEMAQLRAVNVSMGLMLEQMTPSLLQTVHRHAPSKVPERRLAQIEQAGRLRIPFTTGLLLGIGESEHDRLETLRAIAQSHDRWGHIQEVILQPHQPGHRQQQARSGFSAAALAEFVKTAKQYLPAEITVQIPPNLIADHQYVLTAIANGARDLGGLGPKDEVNPDYHHPTPERLRPFLRSAGWQLRPRLPIYPQYDDWLTPQLQQRVKAWRGRLVEAPSPDLTPHPSYEAVSR